MMFPRFLGVKAVWCRLTDHEWADRSPGLTCLRCQRHFAWKEWAPTWTSVEWEGTDALGVIGPAKEAPK